MSEWQDISTAPKDGTRFLAYIPADPEFFGEVQMECGFDGDLIVNQYDYSWAPATHWRPLDPPPRKPTILADGTVDCPYNGQGVAPYKKQEGAE